MALLILRHTLPLVLSGSNLHVFPLFTVSIIIISQQIQGTNLNERTLTVIFGFQLLFLRVLGIMLPIYVVTKAVATCRRHSQTLDTSHSDDSSSDEETDSWRLPQTQSYIIGVR